MSNDLKLAILNTTHTENIDWVKDIHKQGFGDARFIQLTAQIDGIHT